MNLDHLCVFIDVGQFSLPVAIDCEIERGIEDSHCFSIFRLVVCCLYKDDWIVLQVVIYGSEN